MNSPLTRKSKNHSSPEWFSFSFYCDQCGNEWNSPTLKYEQGGFSTVEHEDVKKLIWEQEHKAAFNGANLEAHFHFSFCPKCSRRVCDECFDMERSQCKFCKDNE